MYWGFFPVFSFVPTRELFSTAGCPIDERWENQIEPAWVWVSALEAEDCHSKSSILVQKWYEMIENPAYPWNQVISCHVWIFFALSHIVLYIELYRSIWCVQLAVSGRFVICWLLASRGWTGRLVYQTDWTCSSGKAINKPQGRGMTRT